jgi:hypothetical protein
MGLLALLQKNDIFSGRVYPWRKSVTTFSAA